MKGISSKSGGVSSDRRGYHVLVAVVAYSIAVVIALFMGSRVPGPQQGNWGSLLIGVGGMLGWMIETWIGEIVVGPSHPSLGPRGFVGIIYAVPILAALWPPSNPLYIWLSLAMFVILLSIVSIRLIRLYAAERINDPGGQG